MSALRIKGKQDPKVPYRVLNWRDYNRGLVKRGDLCLWIEDGIEDRWYSVETPNRRGRRDKYSDAAIECVLVLKSLFGLPLRQTTGLLASLFKLSGLDLEVPDYSRISRRQGRLSPSIKLPKGIRSKPIHLVLDGTGLKVFGEGEWKVREHGAGKRRTWRKLHLAIDAGSGQILTALLTQRDTHDAEPAPDIIRSLVKQGYDIKDFRGDGAYDAHRVFLTCLQHGIKAIIPSREGAILSSEKYENAMDNTWPRDEIVKRIRKIGKGGWKTESGYFKRSLVEMAIYRYKRTFGDRLSARNLENQRAEVTLRASMLNKMIKTAKPKSEKRIK